MDGIELGRAFPPPGYKISLDSGVRSIYFDESGPMETLLCANPLVITRRLENIDSGQEKVEVAFYRNNRWKHLIAPRSSIFNKNTIIRYADCGLPVTSDSAEGVVRYLSAYEVTNADVIPFTRSINRIGWLDNEFYPCVINNDIVFEAETEDIDMIVSSIFSRGDFKDWLEAAEKLRKHTYARTMMAASYASPLLEKLQHRVFIIHLWYSSLSGKTAGLKFSISIWGDPLKLVGNFNSTAVGLERRAGALKHLPLGLDELQVLNDKRLSPAMIAYALGNGYGKTRGAKNGGLQDVPTWRNTILSTGEQPLSSENSMDGVNSRVLELYGRPIPDPELGRKIHQISENNHGFAGMKFIKYLVKTILPEKNRLRSEFQEMREALKFRFEGLAFGDCGAHLDNIAVLALADQYSSVCVHGYDADQAKEEAVQLGLSILENAKSLEKEDAVERARSFVIDWIAANYRRFDNFSIPCFGSIDQERVYVVATEFRKALEDGGFSYVKSIKGFKDRNYISSYIDSEGVVRTQYQKRIQGVNLRTICVNIDVKPDLTVEDEFLGGPEINQQQSQYAPS
jgi:putative DNA primase/helicase